MSDAGKTDPSSPSTGEKPPEVDAEAPEAHLESLEEAMTSALELRQQGKIQEAVRLFREILAAEPRLAEPRLELAHLAASSEDWEEAEAQARMAVQILRSGGQWILGLSGEQLLSFAVNLLGEVLVRSIESGDLIFRDKKRFNAIWNEAAALFVEAKALDPSNEDARSNSLHYRPIL
ncbi:MAG: hypothetical protein CL928_00190 [Deltaproteobacteria bacterium]|nr:hypothetical protein [Deltaproteobacteria bacterium]